MYILKASKHGPQKSYQGPLNKLLKKSLNMNMSLSRVFNNKSWEYF